MARAPIDGIILQKYVEEGQIIASGVSNVSGGTPIVDIADMNSVYIEAGIDEIDIGKILAGQSATIIAEAYPNIKFRGKIVRIAPEAKIEQNVTLFDVIVEVVNTEGKLKSGMNTSIEITIKKEENVLLVPTAALHTSKDGGMKNSVMSDMNDCALAVHCTAFVASACASSIFSVTFVLASVQPVVISATIYLI